MLPFRAETDLFNGLDTAMRQDELWLRGDSRGTEPSMLQCELMQSGPSGLSFTFGNNTKGYQTVLADFVPKPWLHMQYK